MFKIRLLTSLLASFIFVSCVNKQKENNIKFSIDYIGGGYDGLMLKNQLKMHLNNFNLLDANSKLQIQADVSHSSDLFITNIDNTSDRERIDSSIQFKVYDIEFECYTYLYKDSFSQFYVLASSEKFTSNKTAVEEIKVENLDYFIKVFINNLDESVLICNEEK